MSIGERPAPRVGWSGEAAARRLFDLVQAACAEGVDLPTRLEAALRAALDALARDPQLAHLLTVQPRLDEGRGAFDSQQEWVGRFGTLLRDAAAGDPCTRAVDPSFLAPFLIGGVRFQISRLVLNGEAADLPRLLPSLLEGLLAYYFEPGEPRRLAHAALRTEG